MPVEGNTTTCWCTTASSCQPSNTILAARCAPHLRGAQLLPIDGSRSRPRLPSAFRQRMTCDDRTMWPPKASPQSGRSPSFFLCARIPVTGYAASGVASECMLVGAIEPRPISVASTASSSGVWGSFAHQNYLSRRGTPKNIADLANHALIGFDETTAFIRDAGKSFSAWRREAFSMRTDNNLAQLALIRSGAGIVVCQAAIAQRDNRIVRILPKQFALPLETWITMHQDLRNSPRCRATFDALVKGLQQHIDSIRG